MDAIQRWHDFFMLTGTAAATLIGLIFVAISFAMTSQIERKRGDLDAWVTPTLVYFAESFVIAGASVAPIATRTLGIILCGLIGFNLPFGILRLRYLMIQHREDAIERTAWIWQVALPGVAQLVLGVGGYGLIISDGRELPAIAIALMMLLVVGVRNAWMLVVYLLEQR
jgi:hypothetical protein